MKLFLNFDESIQYCGTDEKAILGKFIVPGEIDLKMKIFFYQINAATTNIKNTHEVTILANLVCFEFWRMILDSKCSDNHL